LIIVGKKEEEGKESVRWYGLREGLFGPSVNGKNFAAPSAPGGGAGDETQERKRPGYSNKEGEVIRMHRD